MSKDDVESSKVKPKFSSSLADAKKVDSEIYQLLQSAHTIVRPDAKQLETESEGVLALRLGRNCAKILGKLHPDDINSEKDLRRLALQAFDLGLKETLEPKYNLFKEECRKILQSLHAPRSQERYDYYIKTRKFIELFNEFDSFCNLQGIPGSRRDQLGQLRQEMHAILDGKLEGKPADPRKALDYAVCIRQIYYRYRQGHQYTEMQLTAAELTEGERDCNQVTERAQEIARNAALTQLIMGQSNNNQGFLVGQARNPSKDSSAETVASPNK